LKNEYITKLEAKLEQTDKSEKQYKKLFIGAALVILLTFGYTYKTTVLDYAVIENVKLEKDKYGMVTFYFDVVKEGRLDFNYGEYAMLTDKFEVAKDKSFSLSWSFTGDTEISIRSQKKLLPNWDKKTFRF
jgi:hypothetical protein